MVTIYIDDKPYEVAAGENVLQAVLGLGLDLPYFCWHPAMGSVGACRQCALVQFRDEEDTRGRIVMGCMTPATEGARFSMQGAAASGFRKNIVESLMLNHPHDCPVCAEGGECHLQDMTMMVGHRNRSYRGRKNTHNNQDLGPLIHHEMNRCISCYRCTRFYNDYAGGKDLSAQAAHDHVYFGRHEDGTLESEFAGNLVEVCPTGVFTDKPLVNEYTRKWDMQSAPSVCTGCAVGCNIMPGERYGKLKRIHNRYNSAVNGYFLCDRGRFGGNFVNDEQRAKFAGQRGNDGKYDAISQESAITAISTMCGNEAAVVGIGSPRASLEANFLLRELVGPENFCNGMSDHESALVSRIRTHLASGAALSPSLKQVEAADAVLILGEDVTNTAPRLALALRQSVRNLANSLAEDMRIPLWQDEAVRNLAQDQLSPLFIASVSSTRLDDVAEQSLAMRPNDIARLGYAIAAELDPSKEKVEGLNDDQQALAKRAAQALKSAQKPLLVSGTGMQNRAVIDAAAAIVEALDSSHAMLSYCVPEANSLGVSMLAGDQGLSLDQICKNARQGEIQTLIVCENDLFKRADRPVVRQLLKDIPNLVVLDAINSETFAQSSLALPAASYLESEGTLVSSEGRAQRHYPVFQPAEQRQASWRWLVQLSQALRNSEIGEAPHFDDVMEQCAACDPALAGITSASPHAEFRDRGMKIPRQTHRYSGRTAMRADISVHEPKQPEDENTPFSFSMEGANSGKSGALIPFVWSPGWNSNQSIHKFQSEAGGALAGGTPGARLFEPVAGAKFSDTGTAPAPNTGSLTQLSLVPIYRIFGSDELSSLSPAVAELTTTPFVQLNANEATRFGIADGDVLQAQLADTEMELIAEINDSIPDTCVAYCVGLPGAAWLPPESQTSLLKVEAKLRVEQGGPHV